MNADFYLPLDSELIPSGEILSVEKTPFDFRNSQKIGARLTDSFDGYDMMFIVKGNGLRFFSKLLTKKICSFELLYFSRFQIDRRNNGAFDHSRIDRKRSSILHGKFSQSNSRTRLKQIRKTHRTLFRNTKFQRQFKQPSKIVRSTTKNKVFRLFVSFSRIFRVLSLILAMNITNKRFFIFNGTDNQKTKPKRIDFHFSFLFVSIKKTFLSFLDRMKRKRFLFRFTTEELFITV